MLIKSDKILKSILKNIFERYWNFIHFKK